MLQPFDVPNPSRSALSRLVAQVARREKLERQVMDSHAKAVASETAHTRQLQDERTRWQASLQEEARTNASCRSWAVVVCVHVVHVAWDDVPHDVSVV